MSRAADDHLSESEQDELALAPPAGPNASVLDKTTIRARPDESSAHGRKTAGMSSRTQPGRISSADLSVVILALAVLGASLLVLLWLLGGK